MRGKTISRGRVVNAACAASTPGLAAAALAQLPLQRINPFRLIGIFPASREIAEWRWDLNRLAPKTHRWKDQQWISSGFDEPGAQRVRSRTFRAALQQKSAGSLDWLRRLHRSHCAATRAIFHLHAPRGRRDGQLHRSGRFAPPSPAAPSGRSALWLRQVAPRLPVAVPRPDPRLAVPCSQEPICAASSRSIFPPD